MTTPTPTIEALERLQARADLAHPAFDSVGVLTADLRTVLASLKSPPIDLDPNGGASGDLRSRIDAGIRSFVSCEPDFDMSSGMRISLADHILAQPYETLPALTDAVGIADALPPEPACSSGEGAIDRMIRAIPAHANRDWDGDPIQATERDWMRPLALAALSQPVSGVE